MPVTRGLLLSVTTLAATAFAAYSAQATEYAAGRYIPGIYALPGAGIVPPFPGAYWGVSNAFYHGTASANIPVGNNIAVNLDATLWMTAFAGLYVPKWDLPGNWTYAFQLVLPVGRTEATADVLAFSRTDDLAGLGDIQITPLLFGWHNATADTFFSAGLTVTVPSGAYDPDIIAFVGLNYWSVTPSLGFTHLDAANGMDYSAKFGIDINTENEATDYYSGAMAHLDLAVTKSLTEQFSVGVIAGFLYQFEDDESTFADTRPDGFKGRSVAVGPLVKYKAKFDEGREVDFSLSWASELDVKNRLEGDAVYFNISGKF